MSSKLMLRQSWHTPPGDLAFVQEQTGIVNDAVWNEAIDHVNDLEVVDNRLKYKPTGAWYIPVEAREELLHFAHDAPTAGHYGVEITLRKLERVAWWPGMKRYVDRYVKECGICARSKPRTAVAAPRQALDTAGIWEAVHMDLVEFITTSRGNHYLLTLVDRCSKYMFAFPIPNKKAVTITNELLRLFSDVGYPQLVTVDNGKEFDNVIFKEMMNRAGVQVHYTTPYHHQSNGQIERMHRTLEERLRTTVNPDHDNWDIMYDAAIKAMNHAMPTNGARSPSEVWYGRPVFSRLDSFAGLPPPRYLSAIESYNEMMEVRRQTAMLEGRARKVDPNGTTATI